MMKKLSVSIYSTVKFLKWRTKKMAKHNPKIALFISRNKDNKNVEGFKQRSQTFLTSKQYNSLEDR